MNKILLFNAVILTLGFLGGSSAFAIQLPWQNNPTKAIPPTPAIMNVTTSNSTITAGAWDEVLHLIGLRGIEIFGSNNSKTVYFNVTIANENGTNLGSGAKVYKNETSGIWYFRTLHNGTNISITQNSTGITIASAGSGESTTASNIGSSGTGVFSSLVGFDLQFKKLIGAGGNTITSNSTNVIINSTSSIKVNSITCSAGYHLFSINNSTGETTCTQDTTNPTGFTSINNFGTGDASLVGTNQTNIANIKRLVAGTGISISNGTSRVTISSTVTGGFTTVENTGIGTGWVKTNSSNKAEIKGVSSGQGITVSSGTSDNTIATNFKIDTLSTLAVDKFVSAFDNSTGDWTTKTFSVNSKTCSAGQHLFSIDNSTGDVTCTADTSGSSGFTTVENVGGGTLALVKTNQSNKAEIKTLNGGQGITVTNGTSTGTIATNFKIDTLATLAVDRFISAFDNATGDWTSKIFSVNSRTAQPDFFVTGIDNSTGDVAIKQFSVNNSTCVGKFVQQINNVTGDVVCASAPSGSSGFTTIETTGVGTSWVKTNSSNKAEIKGVSGGQGITVSSGTSDNTVATNFKIDTLSTIAVDKFVSAFDNSTGDWTTKTFSINSRTTQPDFFVNGIDNSTGDVAIKQFSINSRSTQPDFFVNGIDNATGDVAIKQFSINNSTCVGQFVQQINNVTGQVVCASAPSGSGGFTKIENTEIGVGLVKTNSSNAAIFKGLLNGTGIRIKSGTSTVSISGIGGPESMMMNMSKRFGDYIPNSAAAIASGILGTTVSQDGTETFEYNTTRGVLSIRSATGAVAGNNAGMSQVTANFNLFRFDQNPKLWIEAAPSANRVGLNRVFIGFQSGATQLPNNADTIVNAASAFGVCIRTTDTTYQRCENDGAGAGTYTNLGVTEDTDWHTFYIYADYDNRKWCVVLDGGTASCATSDIPAATTRLYFNAQGETSVATSTNFNYGVIRVQNDK